MAIVNYKFAMVSERIIKEQFKGGFIKVKVIRNPFLGEKKQIIIDTCKNLGAEICEVDIIKDIDYKIYVIDVNNIGGIRTKGVNDEFRNLMKITNEKMAAAFKREYEKW